VGCLKSGRRLDPLQRKRLGFCSFGRLELTAAIGIDIRPVSGLSKIFDDHWIEALATAHRGGRVGEAGNDAVAAAGVAVARCCQRT
jgi:hypothetical protein